jgi:hypothetical protein
VDVAQCRQGRQGRARRPRQAQGRLGADNALQGLGDGRAVRAQAARRPPGPARRGR